MVMKLLLRQLDIWLVKMLERVSSHQKKFYWNIFYVRFASKRIWKAKKYLLLPVRPSKQLIRYALFLIVPQVKWDMRLRELLCSRGAQVTLVSGPVSLEPPLFVDVVPVESAEDMFQAVTSRMAEQDIIIKAAAVADYTPATVADNKIKKTDGEAAIALTRTKDILGYLGEHRTEKQILCGFSMETENMLENSRKKLDKKHLDLVVANNLKVEGAGFGVDTNVVTLITREGARELPKMTKEEVAGAILDEIVE